MKNEQHKLIPYFKISFVPASLIKHLMAQLVTNLPTVWKIWARIAELERFPGDGHGNQLQHSCLENPHGQRSLVGYSPWSYKESDMTEHTQSQKETNNYCVLVHIYGIEKNDTDEPVCGTGIEAKV